MERGPKRQDDLHDKLEALKPAKGLILANERERNRALKFGRTRGLFFVSRTTRTGEIKLWRME